MTTSMPDESIVQRKDALDRANYIRVKRAQLKRDLKARGFDETELLINPPDWLKTMQLFDFLRAFSKVGKVKAALYIEIWELSSVFTIDDMTLEQRKQLANMLSNRR